MEQYIPKSALVEEIGKMLQEEYPCDNSEQTIGYHCALYELQGFLDTLEVKEVDLEEEIDNYFDNYKIAKKKECWLNHAQAHIFAKHFFELGIKAQKGE